MKTLVVFDFDDTLFKSDCMVTVKSKNEAIKRLNTHEYAIFRPSPGDILDFSEFEKYPVNPRPIKSVVKKMLNFVNTLGISNVIVLTARTKSEPVVQVLKDFSLPQVFVAAVASTKPEMKADFVKMLIEADGYKKVIVFEDNERNIAKIKETTEQILGAQSCKCFLVKS